MPILERDIEGDVVKWAKKHGFLTPKVKFVEVGYPDRLFISPNGHTIFIEFKRPGQYPDPIQAYRLGELERRGIPAVCCDSSFNAINILKAAMEPEGISDASNQTFVESNVGGPLPGPWIREDVGGLGSIQDLKEKGNGNKDAHSRTTSPDVQSLAGRDKEVE